MSAPAEAPPRFDGRRRFDRDRQVEADLTALFARHHVSPLEAVQQFPIFARRMVLKRFLGLWELFRRTIRLPGDIVEIGVFRGLTLMALANFVEITCMGDRSKTVWGFENFAGFRGFAPEDGPEEPRLQKVEGGFSPAEYEAELEEAIAVFDGDRFVPWKPRVRLVKGDVEETVPAFVAAHPGLRLSMLHVDCDLYRPTKVALEHLFPLVVPGGIVLFDDYAIPEWAGESRAVDEYLAGTGHRLRKLPWSAQPGAYLVKT